MGAHNEVSDVWFEVPAHFKISRQFFSRVVICCALLFVCLAVIPSVNCDRKYKVSQFDERDKRETRERYSKRDEGDQRYRRNKYRGSDSDEDYSESRSDRLRRLKREEADEEAPQRTRTYKKYNANENEERVRKVRVRLQLSAVYYTDETDENDLSDSCVNRRGRRCESDDLTDETNEDYTDEDDSDFVKKKKVIYVKKFAHEKRKRKQDKETGNILKIHRRAGLGR